MLKQSDIPIIKKLTFFTVQLTDSANDQTISVKATSTIYWNYEYNSSGSKFIKFTKGTGSWTILDSQASIISRKVSYGANGALYPNTNGYSDQGPNYIYPTSNSFTLYPPTTWKSLAMSAPYNFGQTMYCTMKRLPTGETWDFKVNGVLGFSVNKTN